MTARTYTGYPYYFTLLYTPFVDLPYHLLEISSFMEHTRAKSTMALIIYPCIVT